MICERHPRYEGRFMYSEPCSSCEEIKQAYDQRETKGTNPKDLLGVKKVSISKLPAAGVIHGSCAMMDGAFKYNAYNWRDNSVVASIYVDALIRHLECWFDESQENAEDSGVHHLGHIIANCSILLDAQETGNLVDDRPKPGVASKLLKRLEPWVRARAERAEKEKTAKAKESTNEQ